MAKRKIQRVTITLYVEQPGRPAMPTRQELTDGLVSDLVGRTVGLLYGRDYLGGTKDQEVEIIGVYSRLASRPGNQKGPDLEELRSTPRG